MSVIVPTKNSSETLSRCLASIYNQSYKNIEVIVVDNYSIDNTADIAKQFGASYFQRGPERSAQVNYGAEVADGEFIYKVDADFVLESSVVAECIAHATAGADAVVVHNSPDPSISRIARIRKFEVDMYKYDTTHSSARFVNRNLFLEMHGFNESITAGEDYDFQNRLRRLQADIRFADAEAVHLGEPKRLWPHLKKYFSYGIDFVRYAQENPTERYRQLTPFRAIYFRNLDAFRNAPSLALQFLVYTLLKYLAAGSGFAVGMIRCKCKHHLSL